jgi:hypothetical protein
MPAKPTVRLRETQLEREADDSDAVAAFIESGKSTGQEIAKSAEQGVSKSISQQHDNEKEFKRVTYYLLPDQAQQMKLLAVTQGRNLSALAREAIDAYLREHAC